MALDDRPLLYHDLVTDMEHAFPVKASANWTTVTLEEAARTKTTGMDSSLSYRLIDRIATMDRRLATLGLLPFPVDATYIQTCARIAPAPAPILSSVASISPAPAPI